ncbi:MAG: hypothetical protein HQL63_02240 [Magnetococcales bacterium]|nr:hypothetical protein [Magnetococcales bacterium]MBF0321698.1 hypothetical protein [Magnetococcales bacterium]
MSAVTYDTHKLVLRLREAGFEEKQAEAFSEVFKDVQDSQLKELATKGDIAPLVSLIKDFQSDLRAMDARVLGKIRLNRWMLALVIGVTVLPAVRHLFG